MENRAILHADPIEEQGVCLHYTWTVSRAPTIAREFEPFVPRLGRIGAVDAVALEARAADLAKRSIKRSSKLQALGWKPKIPLREGIAQTYRWYCETRTGVAV